MSQSATGATETAVPTQLPTEGEKVAQKISHSAKPHGCARCPNRWGGVNTSHCGGCHETFTGLSAFEAHRQGDHGNDTRHCVSPTEAGLTMTARGYWGSPGDGTEWWAR